MRERVYFDHDVDKENRSFQNQNLIVISLDFQGSDGTMGRIIFVVLALLANSPKEEQPWPGWEL